MDNFNIVESSLYTPSTSKTLPAKSAVVMLTFYEQTEFTQITFVENETNNSITFNTPQSPGYLLIVTKKPEYTTSFGLLCLGIGFTIYPPVLLDDFTNSDQDGAAMYMFATQFIDFTKVYKVPQP